MEIFQGILPESLIAILACIVAICAAVATILPTPAEGGSKAYKLFHTVVTWLAFNFGKARNESAKAGKPDEPTAATH